jgi:hypothetical protein
LTLLPFAPWQAWHTTALAAPVSEFPAAPLAVLANAPQIVAARIQSRFMIPVNPILK